MRAPSQREGDVVKIYSEIVGDLGWWKGEVNGRSSSRNLLIPGRKHRNNSSALALSPVFCCFQKSSPMKTSRMMMMRSREPTTVDPAVFSSYSIVHKRRFLPNCLSLN
ncbi:hypothetical protein JOB18_009902 [Solea senegalensis]|uniref:SH3 domain-containing protein n=1 Tax=Solea senegalensis TaxID=28829 RepID=A0AAV6R051_SOLSE|nr:hypothetical protein JOB18_009902 [Solea senegalensis]